MRIPVAGFICLFLSLASIHALGADAMQITSSAFNTNAFIPKKYTCEGANVNPPLIFSHVPSQAKSLILTVSDPDAPAKTWVHWVIYNIPADVTGISENTNPETQGLNDFGKYSYGGPCPPDQKPHHYIFRLYAIDTLLDINEPTLNAIEKAIQGHILAQSQLVGLYQKKVTI